MTTSKLVIGTLALLAAALSTAVNETRLVRTQRSFEHARRVAVALARPELAAQHDGELVLLSGLVTSNAVVLDSAGHVLAHTRAPMVLDPAFGIAARGVRLLRHVEMLQWVETSHTSTSTGGVGGDVADVDEDRERVYLYTLRWMSERVDSSRFDNPSYRNPSQDGEPWAFEAAVVTAPDVVVGDFKLSEALIDQIQRREDVKLDTASRRTMRNILDQRLGEGWRDRSALANVTIEEDKYFYLRRDGVSGQRRRDGAPDELGDLRVSFSVVPPYQVTICAQQQQDMLVPFETPATQGGKSIFLLEDGIHSTDEFFNLRAASKFRENRFLRLFSSVVGFIGFLVLHPVLLVTRVGKILFGQQQGTTVPVGVLAASLSFSLMFSVAGMCWLRTRLLYSLGMLAGGLSPTLALIAFMRRMQRPKPE